MQAEPLPFLLQQVGRLDYTAVVKQTDGQGVWNCEHITHDDPSSAIECARREVARRTAPEKQLPVLMTPPAAVALNRVGWQRPGRGGRLPTQVSVAVC